MAGDVIVSALGGSKKDPVLTVISRNNKRDYGSENLCDVCNLKHACNLKGTEIFCCNKFNGEDKIEKDFSQCEIHNIPKKKGKYGLFCTECAREETTKR